MSFHSAATIDKSKDSGPLISNGSLQCKSARNEHAFDGGKFTDLNSSEDLFKQASAGTFAASRFGHDFSRVPVHTDMVQQTAPLLHTGTMVQRVPVNGDTSSTPAPEATSTPATAEPEQESATPEETKAPALLVEDSATELAPGQMRKSEFLARLRSEATSAANAALAGTGRTTADCPYLDYWFGYYSLRDSTHIERALHRYAPETTNATTAEKYITTATERVRRAAQTWAETGRITGVPEWILAAVPGGGPAESGEGAAAPTAPVMAKAQDGGVRSADNPQAIQAELGDGRSLDGGVRSRMESAFGRDFSQVRTHTDTTAAGLSNRLNARAFTVGEHVAFGSGEYQPGTMLGDALIAHEMAHVVQQRGAGSSVASMQTGSSSYNMLENDADTSAMGALASLWGGAKGKLADIGQNAIPRLRSGLRLSSCKRGKEKAKEFAKECIGAKKAKIITLDRTHPKTILEIAGCAPGVMKGKVEFYYQGMKFFVLPIIGGIFYGGMPVINWACPGAGKTVEARIFDKEGNKVATVSKTVTDKRLFPQYE